MSQWEITLNGKEVTNRWARALIIPVYRIWAFLMILFEMLMVVLGIVLTILTPLIAILGIVFTILVACVLYLPDRLLKWRKRKGFIDEGPGYFHINVDLDGFRRR